MSSAARILVVEDDIAIRESLVDLLQEEGYEVACACNGEEALRFLRTQDAPNLIVLDLVMPVMDGWTFRALQQGDPRYADIPVVVVSASHGDRSMGTMAPNAFLPKPFDLDRFVDTVHQFC